MLLSVMVKTSLSHTFHWSVRTCRKPASQTESFFVVDIFSNGANAKSCVFEEKNQPTGQTFCISSLHCRGVKSF